MLLTVAREARAQTPSDRQPTPSPTVPSTPTPVPPEFVLSGDLPDLPEGYMIVEGDIQIRKTEFASRYLSSAPTSPQSTYRNQLWPNGVVPYEFDANVMAANQALAQQAMTDWQSAANVQFVQCASNSCTGDFLHIQNSTSNNSALGRQGGQQIVNIVNWNSRYRIAHELGHALGLVHEQARTDRASFVQINLNNVCKATDANCAGGFCFDNAGNRIDCDFNFNIDNNAAAYGPYDFDSVIHYGQCAFSRQLNCPIGGGVTISVTQPYSTWQNNIGQRTQLSTWDRTMMSLLYPQSNWRFLDANAAPGGSGLTFFSPYQSFYDATAFVPAGGTIVIQPGTYTGAGLYYYKAQTWFASIGGVTLK